MRASLRRNGLRVGLLALMTLTACGDDTSASGGSSSGAGGSGGAGGTGAGGGGGAGPTGVNIPELSAEVAATYDEHGLLHLACASDDDCYAALGYFHAANRFFFMDFVRSSVRGRLGSLVKAGATVLQRDFDNRRFFSTRDGEPLEERLVSDASPEVQGYLQAYARGVNAWLGDMREGRNGATLTTEYDFALIEKAGIREWEPADSAAVGLYVLHDLSNKAPAEIARAELTPFVDPALAPDLFSARPVFAAFTLPSAELAAAPPSPSPAPTPWQLPNASRSALLAQARAGLAHLGSGNESRRPGESGSNNWVLAPGRTTSGNALLADDPHLALTNPAIWFPVEIDAKSAGEGQFHVAGSTFPGLPAVMIGHNESLAWGVTTANWDLSDVYVEELSQDGSSVLFNGQEVAIIEKEVMFDDASTGMKVAQTLRWVPHHGPIVAEDAAAGTALSVRWNLHDSGTDLDGFFALARANSTSEAKDAVALMVAASQNFVVADLNGDIAWYPYSRVPLRPWASNALPPWLPLPGDGSAEWAGYVPLEQLPQAENPAAGAIATANQDLTGASADGDLLNDGQLALQAITRAEGTRNRRILDQLEAGADAHTFETMTALQGDSYSLYGSVVVPAVLEAMQGQTLTSQEQQLVDALTDWKFSCPTGVDGHDPENSPDASSSSETAESIGCTAFHVTLFALTEAALGDEIAAASALAPEPLAISDRADIHLLVRALKAPNTLSSGELLWDNVTTPNNSETRSDVIRYAVTLAAASLAATGEPNDWRWGRLHTLSLRSIYDSFGIGTYNDGPYAAAGGLYTVNVANPQRELPDVGDPWDLSFAAGASVRFVVELGPDRPRMKYQLPGGADLHRESPFYNNLLPAWLDNEPIDFAFGPGAVTNPALEVVVKPAP